MESSSGSQHDTSGLQKVAWQTGAASSGKEAVCSHAKAEGSVAKGALCSPGLLEKECESCAFRRQFWGRQEPQKPCLCIGPVQRPSLLNAAVVKVARHFLAAAPPSSSEVLDTSAV